MRRREDYDGPWKEAVVRYLPALLELCFPTAHAGIDWSRGYEFLDTELRQAMRGTRPSRRRVDALVQVWRQDGEEARVLIHLEVQSQVDKHFARRMFRYHFRIVDRFDGPVASFAVLADENPNWRPDQFGYELWGCRAGLDFPVVKTRFPRGKAAGSGPRRAGPEPEALRSGHPRSPRGAEIASLAGSAPAR
jgi:hypothetical protein